MYFLLLTKHLYELKKIDLKNDVFSTDEKSGNSVDNWDS